MIPHPALRASPRRLSAFASFALALLMGSASALADPPARALRLSYVAGDASFAPAGSDAWVVARLNRPLWIGDRLWSGSGNVELQLGGASIRLAPQTRRHRPQLRRSHHAAAGDAGHGGVARARDRRSRGRRRDRHAVAGLRCAHRGRLSRRRRARPHRRERTSRLGRGLGRGPRLPRRAARAGRLLRPRPARLRRRDPAAPGRRSTAGRAIARAARTRRSPPATSRPSSSASWTSTRTASGAPNATTAPCGTRASTPTGRPTATASGPGSTRGAGRGSTTRPGATRPSHYGRWSYVGSRWGWVPGPREVRPVYAPALVAWVGGDNFSLSIATGPTPGVAWFPLGPGEIWRPGYEVSRDYFTRVNVSNTYVQQTTVVNVYNDYRSGTMTRRTIATARAPAAVTAVPVASFVESRPVQRNLVRMNAQAMAAGPVAAAPAARPVAQSFLGSAPRSQSRPPAETLNRAVVAREAPPAVPTLQERVNVARERGRPLDRQTSIRRARRLGRLPRAVRRPPAGHRPSKRRRATTCARTCASSARRPRNRRPCPRPRRPRRRVLPRPGRVASRRAPGRTRRDAT